MENNSNKKLLSHHGGVAYSAMLAVFIVLSLFVPLVLASFMKTQSLAYRLITLSFSAIAMATVILGFKLKTKQPLLTLTGAVKFHPVWLVASLLLAVGMFCGLGFVNDVFAGLLQDVGLNTESTTFDIGNVWVFVAYFVTLALIPALLEEAFFRGFVLKTLDGCKTFGVLITSGLIFALYHCNAIQFVYQFIYGVLLSALTLKAKSSLPSMLAHLLNNLTVLLFLFLGVEIDLLNGFLIAGGLLALALSVYMIFFFKGKISVEQGGTPNQLRWFYLPFGVFGVVVCLSLIIGGLLI